MKRLAYHILQLQKKDREGSIATQKVRIRTLNLCVEQLHEAGFKTNNMTLKDLKGRHINALLERWRDDGLSVGTIKNRLSALRWLADKIGNKELLKSNEELGIEKRVYITNKNKATDLEQTFDFSKLSEFVFLSVCLQEQFGLRREEAMKFQIEYALQGYTAQSEKAKFIAIKPSWAKGGRYREIPILTEKQKSLLKKIENFVKENNLKSLIPNEKNYKEHMKKFENETRSAGIGRTHGLRHLYAQRRYFELMGFHCPAIDSTRQLTIEEKKKDKEVRLQISQELGHNRISVTGVYLGSWSLAHANNK